jgi:hypothetical protein
MRGSILERGWIFSFKFLLSLPLVSNAQLVDISAHSGVRLTKCPIKTVTNNKRQLQLNLLAGIYHYRIMKLVL